MVLSAGSVALILGSLTALLGAGTTATVRVLKAIAEFKKNTHTQLAGIEDKVNGSATHAAERLEALQHEVTALRQLVAAQDKAAALLAQHMKGKQ